MQKLILNFNCAPKYRAAIYQLIDQAYDCEWAFGEYSNIKPMDYSLLKGKVYLMKNHEWHGLKWQCGGAIGLAFKKDAKAYMLLGDPTMLTIWLIAVISRVRSRKVYFWTHGWYGREGWAKKIIKKMFFGLANKVFVYGNHARELMLQEGFKAEKVVTIYNSLDYDGQLALRETLQSDKVYENHFGNKFPTLIFVGRLLESKRLDLILDAMAIAAKQGHVYNLMLIGDGLTRGLLENKMEALHLKQHVWFYGECYDDKEMCGLLYNADLCVSPRNIGLSAIHTLTYGTPVITNVCFETQMPEAESVVPGYTGDFFKFPDANDLSDKIQTWLDAHPDREAVRKSCYAEIDARWNPHRQIDIFKKQIDLIDL